MVEVAIEWAKMVGARPETLKAIRDANETHDETVLESTEGVLAIAIVVATKELAETEHPHPRWYQLDGARSRCLTSLRMLLEAEPVPVYRTADLETR